MTAVRCPACGDTREASCGADDCPVPLVASGYLTWSTTMNLVAHIDERAKLIDVRAELASRSGQKRWLPVIADPNMPPGYFEMRSGEQRMSGWVDGAANHDPGDEDKAR